MLVNTPADAARVWREDMVAAALSALVVAGLYLDGWSHLNRYGGTLGTFFTPWHGLLYAAFSSNAAWVVSRNRHLWHPEIEPHAALFRVGRYVLRYPYAIFGLGIATVGMLGDVAWHTAFGEETGVARVIAPFHVLLVLGAALLVLAPLRSAAHAPDVYPASSSLGRALPPVVALATFTLGVPMLLTIQRWPRAFGAATAITGMGAFAMVTLGSYDVGWSAIAVVAGGAVADVVVRLGPRVPAHAALYLAAALFPIVTWSAYFVIARTVYDAPWPADFALGVAAFAALALSAVNFVLTLPDAP